MTKSNIIVSIIFLLASGCTKDQICFPDFQDCPDGEETGGSEDVDLSVAWCTQNPTWPALDVLCFDSPINGYTAAGSFATDVADACSSSWQVFDWFGSETGHAMLCNPSGSHGFAGMFTDDTDSAAIRLCERTAVIVADQVTWYTPAMQWPGGDPQSNWQSELDCSFGVDVGACELGFVSLFSERQGGMGQTFVEHTATCKCESDTDCQSVEVCELGYVLEGMHPQPTLCTVGAVPTGPDVYGLDVWADGIVIDGRTITVTESFLVVAIGQAALWNDGQMVAPVDDDGTVWKLTECSDGALCSHMELEVGDRFHFDLGALSELNSGGSIHMTLVTGGEPADWTIQIAA